jgi:hypothetical protein
VRESAWTTYTTTYIRIGLVVESYYAARSARDPHWREQQIAEAREREQRRRELDLGRFRAQRRDVDARYRARAAAHGLTFAELLLRSPRGDRESLQIVLNDELRRGRIDYCSTLRRYSMNGALPDDVRRALRDLEL